MANIPKKVIDRFVKAVPKFQKVLQIAKDRDINESDTVSVLNDIFSEVFGYDKYLEITSELAIRGTYCDLAIKIDDKIHFLAEAKAVGMDLKEAHVKQAIDYGANHGVQWVILSNAIEWRLYRIRFEQPINFDLVVSFKFPEINAREEKYQDILFLLSKEGIGKNVKEAHYDKVQSVNRYVIGNLLLGEPVITVLRRELKRLADGIKIEAGEIENIVRSDVLKREIVEGDQAEIAAARVNKFYKKTVKRPPRKPAAGQAVETKEPEQPTVSVTEKLLGSCGSEDYK